MCTRSTAQHAQSDTDTGLGILLFHGCFQRNAVELVLLIHQFVVHFETPAQTEVRIVEQIVESSVSQVAAGPLCGLLSRVRILSHVTRQAHTSKRVATPFFLCLTTTTETDIVRDVKWKLCCLACIHDAKPSYCSSDKE